ncbi:MAG: S1 RNA-binding domain-containing protein [Candidatus Marsarchaeota archaeon]|nr:S1 RNA-binding domain-containing protein [Candidatus Marsarchaeota archaeon]
MILQKQLPDNQELVLIRIKKIMPHGAYAELTEYGKDAYLPISEIASGWIKNIHEFIKEGQKDVAKVISVDKEKGSIDISLKKATTREKTTKQSEYNLEKRYEKLFEQAAGISGLKDKKDIDALKSEAAKKVSTYTELINNTQEDRKFTSFLKNKKFSAVFDEIIQKNIKLKRYIVTYLMEMQSCSPKAGVSQIKEALAGIEGLGVSVLYLGAPRYRLTAEGGNYLEAEEKIKLARNILDRYSGVLSFEMKKREA